jgi:hypothetical protein
VEHTPPHSHEPIDLTADYVFEDHGPSHRYLAEAWQQVAAPSLHAVPSRRPRYSSNGDFDLEERIAYWNPLLHLSTNALSWASPELGFWRWQQMGRPREDAVLATIDQRFGDDLDVMIAWLVWTGGDLLRRSHATPFRAGASRHHLPAEMITLSRAFRNGHMDNIYARLFGGGWDPLHLIVHLPFAAGGPPPEVHQAEVTVGSDRTDYLLVGNQVPTLFKSLTGGIIPPQTNGRSTRVGVLCPPLGWLGVYRNSRETGGWFRGRHRWHMLGNAPFGSWPHDE